MADEGHVNQSKKVGGRNFEEEFGQALFFVSPTPDYVARETKIEPDRRLGTYTVVLNDSVLQGSLSNHCSNTPDTLSVKLNI